MQHQWKAVEEEAWRRFNAEIAREIAEAEGAKQRA
jgi:hypothetical protein